MLAGKITAAIILFLALASPISAHADMHGQVETRAHAQQRRLTVENLQKLVDVTPQYRRLQENSQRMVLIVRAEGQGPEAISELIQSVDSIMYWFIKKRGGQREWFVNLEWDHLTVGAQFLLNKQDAPPPFPSTADELFAKFSFTFATDQALEGFSKWCRAGGQARVARPCAGVLEQAGKRGMKF